jgi:hypothetical protein
MVTWCGRPALVMRGCGVVVVRELLVKWVGTKRDEGLTVVYHNKQ